MISQLFLRQIPAALEAGIRSGDLAVYGSVIRSPATGQIAGFLQEAGGLSRITEALSAGPLAPLKLVGDAIQVVQNVQIKGGIARLEQGVEVLNQLGVANLALGAVGIGVSVAGFAVMSHKIDGMRADVRALGDKLDELLDAFARDRTERIDDMIEALGGLSRRIDHRGSYANQLKAQSGWHDDADEADTLGTFFYGRARRLLNARPFAVAEVTPLLDGMTMASSLRIAALALANETTAAVEVAREDALRIERLTGRIGASDLVRARLREWKALPGTDAGSAALTLAATKMRTVSAQLRQREAAAATRAAPLIALVGKGAKPRDWLLAARAEQETPLLLLEA